MAERAYI
jgi:hypothetical protein